MNSCDIKGDTKVAAVLGYPVKHSLSPFIHNSLRSITSKDIIYVPFEVEPACLKEAVMGLKALNVAGFNVTVPHKQAIIPFLDEVQGDAVEFGAVNTVVNNDSRLIGFNTDGEGFVLDLSNFIGHHLNNKIYSIIGAGGSARAAAFKLAQAGASHIFIINRTLDKAVELCETVKKKYGCSTAPVSIFQSQEAISNSEIIINTTSCGMYPCTDLCPVECTDVLHKSQYVYDLIYNPKKTKLLSLAEEKGCKISNGLGMLVFQAIISFTIWSGCKFDKYKLKEIYEIIRAKI